MADKNALVEMLKFSFSRIRTMDDYDKKLRYLNDFKEDGIIDHETYSELYKFLKKERKRLQIT